MCRMKIIDILMLLLNLTSNVDAGEIKHDISFRKKFEIMNNSKTSYYQRILVKLCTFYMGYH